MAINQLIAQGAQTQGINPAGIIAGAESIREQQGRNKLLGLTTAQFEKDQPVRDAQGTANIDQSVAQSLYAGAVEVQPYVDAGDYDGAKRVVRNRIATIDARDGDSQHSREALQMLESDNPEQVKQFIDSIVEQGRQSSRFDQTPSSQREFEFFNTLSPEQQQQFLQVKRNTRKVTDVGGVKGVINKETGDFGPAQVSGQSATLGGEVDAQRQLSQGKSEGTQAAVTAAIPAQKSAESEQAELSGHIDRAFPAAESVPVLKRALTLLDDMETGGINQVGFEIRRRFGVEGADEGELSNNLGKAVLSQLRETFGAAFTENEGNRLEAIEAGFGKSTASNRRLLANALTIVEQIANRGVRAARVQDRGFAADELERAMNLDLSPDTAASNIPQAALDFLKANPGTREQFIENYGNPPEGY